MTYVFDAVTSLKSGNILAYPTESVWGLGCDPFNEMAYERLLALKNRPAEKGVILIAGSVAQVMPYLQHVPEDRLTDILASWECTSAATTWLIPLASDSKNCNTGVDNSAVQHLPSWLSGKHNSIALRVTAHPLVQALCHALGSCLVSTSCNPAQADPARTYAQAQAYFSTQIDYLQGETLGFQQPSRIVDAITGDILR